MSGRSKSQRLASSRGKQGTRGKRSGLRGRPIQDSTEDSLKALKPEQEQYVRDVIGKPRKAA